MKILIEYIILMMEVISSFLQAHIIFIDTNSNSQDKGFPNLVLSCPIMISSDKNK